jgi:uncharacterized protein
VVCNNIAMKRYLYKTLNDFIQNKFVLIAGPRQVGKTTMAKAWLDEHQGLYLNWDIGEHRAQILKKTYIDVDGVNALIFDELHKYPRWKNYLKGLFDDSAHRFQVVVTGSARLDIFRRGGDSLFGRYELLRLHPYSIGELTHGLIPPPPTDWLTIGRDNVDLKIWERLLLFGGFPEPFERQDSLQHERWSMQRRELLIRQDLRDLFDVKLVELVEHLYLLLPERVGSTLSLNSLKEELQIAYNTVVAWILILERLYICYRLSPYYKKISRSLKKEQKLYLWDWSQIQDVASKFENIVASHLLKAVHAWRDLGYGNFDLMYWRNKEKQEIDFIVTKNRSPVALIECKYSDQNIAEPLAKLSTELGGLPAIQLVATPGVDHRHRNIRVVSAAQYLASLV